MLAKSPSDNLRIQHNLITLGYYTPKYHKCTSHIPFYKIFSYTPPGYTFQET